MKWLLMAVLAGIGFVLVSSAGLPETTASHFASGGQANGFMSRWAYMTLMSGLTAGIPLLLAGSVIAAMKVSGGKISLPNREYWLAPERQAASVDWLIRHTRMFAMVLLVFLCYVHWLVVRANALQPPRLEESLFIGGLVAFFGFLAAWLIRLVLRFRRAP